MGHRTQHWIPSSYLRAWCDPEPPLSYEPYVWRFSKEGDKVQRRAPHNIFAETDFYTIHPPGGQRDLSLEHGLATLEQKFCQIRDTRIASREPLTTEEKVWFCAFVAAMRVRTRAQRNALRRQWRHVVAVAEEVQQALRAMTPEERAKYKPPISLGETNGPSLTVDDVKILADKPIQHMLSTIVEEHLPVLVRMNLVIFTTGDNIGFITSDHPCVWFDPDRGRRPPMLHSRTLEVMMPVSPNSLALLCWEDFPTYKSMTIDEVDNANRFQQVNCDEYFVVQRNATKPVWFT